MLTVRQRYRRTDGRTTYDSNTALALRASRSKNRIALYNPVIVACWFHGRVITTKEQGDFIVIFLHGRQKEILK